MIKKIAIKNFTTLSDFSVSENQLSMLNVIIGENDTGKTAILKLLYSASRSVEELALKNNTPFKKILAEKLIGVFQPKRSVLGELISKGSSEKLSLEMLMGKKQEQNIYFSFGSSTINTINDCLENIKPIENGFNTLFIPAKEVLTAFDAIAATRENLFMDGFDDTYLDLIRTLRIKQSKGNVAKELKKINTTLEELFEGVLSQNNKDTPFVFKKNKNEFSMSQTAEGIKKIGILTTLIRNRQLGNNTILFMDEPETALHPKAVRSLARMLIAMSKSGVQIFISSHSYFLIKQLSILAIKEDTDVMCHSLQREELSVVHNTSNLKDGLPSNPIIDEAMAMFSEEISVQVQK